MTEIKVLYEPLFRRLTGRASESIKLDKPTITNLVQSLAQKYDKALRDALVDPATGSLTEGVVVLVNGCSSPLNVELKDGDEVAFFIMAYGG